MRAKPIRKIRLRPVSPNIKTQAFLHLEQKWYSLLAQEGFKDIEDTTLTDRPLIKWSGLNHNNAAESDKVAPKEWPDSPFALQQELLYHPALLSICQSICKHGNNSLDTEAVKKILEMHAQGMNCRQIGKLIGVSYVTVFRVQKKLIEWSMLIESRND